MSKVNVIIVGVGEWEQYTLPCIKSIRKQEPDVDITLVDAGSKEPYPSGDDYKLIRMEESKSYAQAINTGIKDSIISDKYYWYLIANNDTLFHKPFVNRIEQYDPGEIYGFHIFNIKQRLYISSFAFIVPWQAIDDVGYFDEQFIPMGYEDADFCWRAQEAGYELSAMRRDEFGVEHLYDPDKEPFYPGPYELLMRKYGLQ